MYSTSETFPIVFNNNIDASATNSLLVIPATGVAVTIASPTGAIAASIKLLNARFITFDGLNSGGSSLSITNSNTITTANIWLASGSGIGTKNITIKNLTLTGASNTVTSVYGINSSVDGANPTTTAGADNDNTTIQGNSLQLMYTAISAIGSGASPAGGLDNLTISNNLIGPASNGTNNLGANGIAVNGAVNLNITANTVRNFSITGGSIDAIRVAATVLGFTITQNTVTSLYCSAAASGGTSPAGIFAGGLNGIISYNTISHIENTNTGGYGARGIMVSTSNASSNVKIFNNMISDIVSYSNTTPPYWPIGIEILGSSGLIDVDFNTVNLFGTHSGLNAACGSAAMAITSAANNIRIRNNIFTNTYENSTSATDIVYALYSPLVNTNYTAIDNNNYYAGGTAVQNIGYSGSTAYTTLSSFAAAIGQNS